MKEDNHRVNMMQKNMEGMMTEGVVNPYFDAGGSSSLEMRNSASVRCVVSLVLLLEMLQPFVVPSSADEDESSHSFKVT